MYLEKEKHTLFIVFDTSLADGYSHPVYLYPTVAIFKNEEDAEAFCEKSDSLFFEERDVDECVDRLFAMC